MNFNNEEEVSLYIKEIVKNKDPLRHDNYDASVEHARQMSVHINGDPPGELIDSYRPNESKESRDYRLKIYQPITKSKSKKVINVISRIKNTKNFKINWDEEKRPRNNLIKFEDSLENYTNKKFPFFRSLTDWVFMVVLKQDLVDPNSVIAFKPIGKDENGYLIPFGFIFSSENVWDYKVDEYYTLLTQEKSWVKRGKEEVKEGNVINVYTKTQIIEFRQVGEISKNKYVITILWEYDFDETPVVRLQGEYIENTFFLYESYMAGVLPFWNDAIREYSDKQATFVNHVFPERVEMEIECTNAQCKGGEVQITSEGGNTKIVSCAVCGGSGRVLARSPFTNTVVRHKDPLDENDPVFPGVEYIQKDTASTELLVKDIQDLITNGFAALNMEFLANIPLNQSGKAKEVDRTELNSYIQQIADNLFRIKKKSYWYVNLWRYGVMLSEDELKENMPEIIAPTSFDLVTSEDLINKINSVKDTSPQVADVLDDELAEKQFPNDPDKREFVRAVSKLDPLPHLSLEDKNLAVQSGAATEEDYVISVNLTSFLRELMEDEFFSLERSEKIIKLRQLAKRVIDANKKPKENPGQEGQSDGQFGGEVRDDD